MARYMAQRVFNSCAILAAKYYYDDEVDEAQIIAEIVRSYQVDYMDDTELLNDIDDAAKKIAELIRKTFSDRDVHPVFDQLRFLNENYELDERKRKRKIFDGTFFHREKKYNRRRVEECVRDVLVYHTGSITGLFPLKDD